MERSNHQGRQCTIKKIFVLSLIGVFLLSKKFFPSLYDQLIGQTVNMSRRTEKTTTVTKKTKIPKRRMRKGDP